jgi:hypothetical protein
MYEQKAKSQAQDQAGIKSFHFIYSLAGAEWPRGPEHD